MEKLRFFEMRQQELAHFVNDIEEGNISALTGYANINKLEKEFKRAKEQIEPLAMEEAQNYPGRSFEQEGIKFELRTGATRYSYKGVSAWVEAKKHLKSIEERSKQAFIAKQKGMLTATEDGEEIELPEINYSKDSLIVK